MPARDGSAQRPVPPGLAGIARRLQGAGVGRGGTSRPEPHPGPRDARPRPHGDSIAARRAVDLRPALAEPGAEGLEDPEVFQTRPSREHTCVLKGSETPSMEPVAAGVEIRKGLLVAKITRLVLAFRVQELDAVLVVRKNSLVCSEGFEMISEKGLYCSGSN